MSLLVYTFLHKHVILCVTVSVHTLLYRHMALGDTVTAFVVGVTPVSESGADPALSQGGDGRRGRAFEKILLSKIEEKSKNNLN